MKVIIQRTKKASVKVNNGIVGSINNGFVLLVGFTNGDSNNDIDYIVDKIINIRIFEDNQGKMNLSLKDVKGSILSVSQFTLYGDTKKGRRPGFENSLNYIEAEKLYNIFNHKLVENDIIVEKGIFGANMEVELINDGPVTFIIDSRE